MNTPEHTSPDFLSRCYAGRRVLVTGDTGFKGSWLSLWLHELGAQVTGTALPSQTEPSHFRLVGLDTLIRHVDADVRSQEALENVFQLAKPQIVFHLAAQALVRDSYADPKATFDINIGGTVNVLEAVRRCPGVKAVVVVTSDKCYENQEWVWGYRESDPLGGHDPYSASKGAVEIVASAYRRSYFDREGLGPHLGLATARAGNVIGGGDWAKDRIIPDCVRALSAGEPIVLRNPHSTRPWQHVLDPLAGYLLLAARLLENPGAYSGAWNFGPRATDQITVRELAERFTQAWGQGVVEVQQTEQQQPHEAHLLNLNTDKAAFALQWHPVLESIDAIDWTVEWYKSWREHAGHPRDLSVRQIREFQKQCSITKKDLLEAP